MKNFYVLTAVFIVLFAVSGIYWLYFQSILIESPQPQEEVITTESIAVDTSDWQIYRNEEFGVSFQYPIGYGYQVEKSGSSNYSAEIIRIKFPQDKEIVDVHFVTPASIETYAQKKPLRKF